MYAAEVAFGKVPNTVEVSGPGGGPLQTQDVSVSAEQLEAEKRLADLSPIEREIAQLLQAKTNSDKKDYLVLIDALKARHWQGDDQHIVAERVKKMMQEEKIWKESSAKKNPAKDQDYQRTLEVLKQLEQ